MGGHGGLNIIPKKSWNVYGRDNRERVKRDEAEAEERRREKEKEKVQEERDARWQKLSKQQQRKGADEGGEREEGHVNLFEREEREERRTRYSQANQAAGKECRRQQLDESHRFARTCQGGGETSKPWYARAGTSLEQQQGKPSLSLPARLRREREEVEVARQQKRGVAAPVDFKVGDETLEKRGIRVYDSLEETSGKTHRRRKKKRKKSKSSTPKPKSIEELRSERLERERLERKRCASLFVSRQQTETDGQERIPERDRPYHSGYLRQL